MATDSRMWTEAKHSLGNNQSRQVFIAPSEGHQQSWPHDSKPDTSIPGREWVIITVGGWLFSILPVHPWESSLPTANYVITAISSNNLCHVSFMKLLQEIKMVILSSFHHNLYRRHHSWQWNPNIPERLQMILKRFWIILSPQMHDEIIQIVEKIYMELWSPWNVSLIGRALSWNQIICWLLQPKNTQNNTASVTCPMFLKLQASNLGDCHLKISFGEF